jgi:hypothetical protein
LVTVIVTGCSSAGAPPGPGGGARATPPPADGGSSAPRSAFPAEPYATGTSDDGELKLEVRTAPSQPPPRGTSTVELTVHDASGPVDGLEVTVVPWMDVMGHGSPITPSVTPKGGGKYVITNVSFFMPGTWSLRLSFSGAAADRATIDVDVP